MELTKEMWNDMSASPYTGYMYATRGSVARVLASIPEPGALTDGEWRVIENGVDQPTLRKLRSILARRPAPAPEPNITNVPGNQPPTVSSGEMSPTSFVDQSAPQQDDAAVVEEMCKAADDCTESYPNFEYCGMRAALAVARRDMVSIEAVEKAMRGQWAFPAIQNMDEWIAGVLARLIVPKPPSKQERVAEILRSYNDKSGSTEDMAAEIVAELEASDGK